MDKEGRDQIRQITGQELLSLCHGLARNLWQYNRMRSLRCSFSVTHVLGLHKVGACTMSVNFIEGAELAGVLRGYVASLFSKR